MSCNIGSKQQMSHNSGQRTGMYSFTISSIVHNNICDKEQQGIARKYRQLQQRFQVQRKSCQRASRTLQRSQDHPRVERGQTIAIGAVTVKGENMQRYGLFLVKILHFEVDNLSPEFLRWVRVPIRQLTQTPDISRPLEEDMSSHKTSSRRVEGLKGSIIGRGRIDREVGGGVMGSYSSSSSLSENSSESEEGHTVKDGAWVET